MTPVLPVPPGFPGAPVLPNEPVFPIAPGGPGKTWLTHSKVEHTIYFTTNERTITSAATHLPLVFPEHGKIWKVFRRLVFSDFYILS